MRIQPPESPHVKEVGVGVGVRVSCKWKLMCLQFIMAASTIASYQLPCMDRLVSMELGTISVNYWPTHSEFSLTEETSKISLYTELRHR